MNRNIFFVPTIEELEEEACGASEDGADGASVADGKAGRRAHLVLPFSFWHRTLRRLEPMLSAPGCVARLFCRMRAPACMIRRLWMLAFVFAEMNKK